MDFKKNNFIHNFKTNFLSVLTGIISTGLFFTGFYVFGIYFPFKFPAAIPFLISDQVSNLVADDSVVDDTPVDGSLINGDLMNYPNKLAQLDNKIKDAGIPIDGVALLNKETHEIRIDFKPEATEDQKSKAREIANNFDWTVTYKDIFNADRAKQEIMQQYPSEKLAMISSHLPIINYFLDQKEFKKLKSFINELFLQGIISQDDYMVLANALASQKIYLNPNFSAVADNPSIGNKPAKTAEPSAPAGEPSSDTGAENPDSQQALEPPVPEPDLKPIQSEPEITTPSESSDAGLQAFLSGQESEGVVKPEVTGAVTENPAEPELPTPTPKPESETAAVPEPISILEPAPPVENPAPKIPSVPSFE